METPTGDNLAHNYTAAVARVVELEEENRALRKEGEFLQRVLNEKTARVQEQLGVLMTCAGLAARLEKAEDTILALQEIAWARIKLGGQAAINSRVERFGRMSNRLEQHRDLMEAKLASDDLARKLNGS